MREEIVVVVIERMKDREKERKKKERKRRISPWILTRRLILFSGLQK
jgi:hypothetical protein